LYLAIQFDNLMLNPLGMQKSISIQSLLIIVATLCFAACSSPQKAFDKNNYQKALRLSVERIQKGKADETDYDIASKSSKELVDEVMIESDTRVKSDKVGDWISAQSKYHSALENIGKANQDTDGLLTANYDILCEAKKDLDFKIIDHFYVLANDQLDEAMNTGDKKSARNAYGNLEKCVKHGGENEFYDLPDLKAEAIERGTVYFVSSGYSPSESFWFKYWNEQTDRDLDCTLNYDIGHVYFNETSSTTQRNDTKDIQVRTETYTDTSGVVHNTPIYETVSATISTTVVTVTASNSMYRHVVDESGQCPLGYRSLSFNESDKYEEIKVSGDQRALHHIVTEKSGEPAFLKFNLENTLMNNIYDSF